MFKTNFLVQKLLFVCAFSEFFYVVEKLVLNIGIKALWYAKVNDKIFGDNYSYFYINIFAACKKYERCKLT